MVIEGRETSRKVTRGLFKDTKPGRAIRVEKCEDMASEGVILEGKDRGDTKNYGSNRKKQK